MLVAGCVTPYAGSVPVRLVCEEVVSGVYMTLLATWVSS